MNPHNALTPCVDARLLGRAGDSADACLLTRAYSNWARGPYPVEDDDGGPVKPFNGLKWR